MRSSAFQAAAPSPPATMARLPAKAKNSGSRARGPIRTGGASAGLRKSFIARNTPQLRKAGTAFRSGAQGAADLLDAGRLLGGQRCRDGLHADAEAGTDQGVWRGCGR